MIYYRTVLGLAEYKEGTLNLIPDVRDPTSSDIPNIREHPWPRTGYKQSILGLIPDIRKAYFKGELNFLRL